MKIITGITVNEQTKKAEKIVKDVLLPQRKKFKEMEFKVASIVRDNEKL